MGVVSRSGLNGQKAEWILNFLQRLVKGTNFGLPAEDLYGTRDQFIKN